VPAVARHTDQPRPDPTTDVVIPTDWIPFPDSIARVDFQPDRVMFTFAPLPGVPTMLDCGCLTSDVDVLHDEDHCVAEQLAADRAYDEWLTAHYTGAGDDDYMDALEDGCCPGRYPR
jgi:hypothetical protein